MNIKELADRFDGVKWNGENKLQCRCPAHADDTASLSISEKDGKLLLHCHAGCDTFDILAAVGLTFKDIGNGFLPDRKKFEWKERMAYGVSKQIGAECHFSDEYKYTDKHGNYLYSKVRFEGGGKKQIRYAIVDETLDSYVNVVPKDKVLYNLPALLKTARQGFPIYYVEGEKDVETLRKLGYTATTAGGANDWRKEYAESFTGTRLYILEDNDEAGQLLTQRILIVNILGAKNCCSVALQSLHERFSTSVLYGKRLNAVGDQQYTEIETSSVFKQLTGGDSIFCEPKNKQAYSFIFRGGLIFACNDLPSFSDDKGGHVFERMTIVPCNNSVAQNERISNLSDLMYNERQAVVNWALEGLHRLMENGYHFTECDEINSVTEEYRENVDSVRRFVNIKYIITGDESDRIKKAELENEYFRWCADENVHAVAKRNIKMRFKKNGIEIIKSHGEWYYTGITSLEKGII